MKNIKCLIFDYGNVLTHPQVEGYVDKIIAILNIEKTVFLKDYYAFRKDYDRGLITSDAYWALILSKHHIMVSQSDMDRLKAYDVKSWTSIDENMIAYIHSLKNEVSSLAILSNMNFDVLNVIKKSYQWLNDFDHTLYSCEHLIIKPDRKIFEKIIDRVGYKPEACLFIDDVLENIEGASAYGLNTIHYQDLDRLKSELKLSYRLL